ncbi:MAG: restriction endonuclease [Clostridia bacterium]|nr:restriction endonuclease [Clostridia bacterium]
MLPKSIHKRIYTDLVNMLDATPMKRADIITRFYEIAATSEEKDKARLRARVGAVISEMLDDGIITVGDDGLYRLKYKKPTAIKAERVEREIIALITNSPMKKGDISRALTVIFETGKTRTLRDDGMINELVPRILKKLCNIGILSFDGTRYSLSTRTMARADDVNAIAALKAEFLSRLHYLGGEFFEHYFMSLLEKYLKKQGLTVTECRVEGGSDDGGIDGVCVTTDRLGFKETVMVQTKNRNAVINERDVRGFYGAVYARRGTRGIVVTTSTFHSGAIAFFDGVDDCIGIDGERVFFMALECAYGIKRVNRELIIDSTVI